MKKTNEYETWYKHNDPQNAREGFKEYNHDFSERYERPKAYVRSGQEYNRFAERYDYTQDQDKKNSSEDQKQQKQQDKNSTNKIRNFSKSIVKTVAGNAVALVVGALVLVAGYNAIIANNARMYNATWVWSEDYHYCVLKLESDDKSVRKEIDIVTKVTEEVPATCVDDGHRVHLATGEYEDKTYSSEENEVLHALGHKFDEGKIVGDHIEYTCSNCGEHITVSIDIEEKD